MRKANHIVSIILSLTIIISISITSINAETFSDVSSGAWYSSAIDYVSNNGLMAGTGNGQFSPNAKINRAMLAQILFSYSGKPTSSSGTKFTDVSSSDWFYDASSWASGSGIMSGYDDGRFGGTDLLIREQLVTVLWRFAGSPSISVGMFYKDRNDASDYAQQAISWAREMNIMCGYNDYFKPKETVTRGELAAILQDYTLMGPNSMSDSNNYVLTASIDSSKQQTFYLWTSNNMPSSVDYTVNRGNYLDDPDFIPTITTYPVPSGTSVKGAVILLAGGSYEIRSNGNEGYAVADALRKLGYVCFLVNYRVQPYTTADSAIDIARAIRFVRSRSFFYGFNCNDVSVLGFSAGAMAAGEMLIKYKSTTGQAIDSSYSPDILDYLSDSISGMGIIYGYYGNLKSAYTDPYLIKSASLPSTYMCYSSDDSMAERCHSCCDVLKQCGIDVCENVISGYGHGFGINGNWITSYDEWLTNIYNSNSMFAIF